MIYINDIMQYLIGEIIMAATKCGHNAVCICATGKGYEVKGLLNERDDTQIDEELMSEYDSDKEEDNNITRKRLRSQDGANVKKKMNATINSKLLWIYTV